ncbi:MAG: hypothetical protein ACP5UA_03120 [Candidatus Hydrogenedens sp.]
MDSIFYSIEKGEAWLTPYEKRQWREKYRALQVWFQNNGIEISPWLQVRLRELLILTFFIQRLEQEFLLSPLMSKKEDVCIESSKKTEKTNHSLQYYEILCKYMERQRKLVQEFENIKPVEAKTSSMSIAELVQDLVCCMHELEKGNGTMQKNLVVGSKEEILVNQDN